ncbi:MAG: hypothetical protein M3220_07300 [Chloroflexota bacterium]|nr:hypothetical protein [Chloroflexota bacterium]
MNNSDILVILVLVLCVACAPMGKGQPSIADMPEATSGTEPSAGSATLVSDVTTTPTENSLRPPSFTPKGTLTVQPTETATSVPTTPTYEPSVTETAVPTQAATATATASTPISNTDPASEEESEGMIVFERSGGFAGITEQWTIYSDGRVVNDKGSVWEVAPGEVQQLLDEIESLGFFDLEGKFIPKDPCCDFFTYVITVRDGDQENTVTTVDIAPNMPAALQEVIDKINQFLSNLAVAEQ